jgi:tetratricopeptide (TPR) repeat protein
MFIILASLCWQSASAQQARFEQANDLLEQMEYRQAISQYLAIADEGYHSGALWLNLGIAYTELDSLGLSKYYFLKASKYPETRREAESGLQFVEERFSRRSAVLPPLPWERFFSFLSDRFGTSGLFTAGFIVLYLGVSGIILAWFVTVFQSHVRYSGITLIGISLLLFLSSYYIQYLDNRYQEAVVTDRQATVYSNPDPSSAQISTAHEGYLLRIDRHNSDNHSGWHYIRLENGMAGWIENEPFKVL